MHLLITASNELLDADAVIISDNIAQRFLVNLIRKIKIQQ